MYIVLLHYIAPVEEIDLMLPEHVEWLGKQYKAGYFLISGRGNPRSHSVIITRPMTRTGLNALLATNPLVQSRRARAEVIEFQATRTAPELAAVNEALLTQVTAR